MIQLLPNNKKKLPDADYTLDTMDKLEDMISVLTPKFQGKWLFVLLDPKIKFVKEMLDNHLIPDWVDVKIFLSSKKIEQICLEFPEYTPKKVSVKDSFNELLASIKHVVDPSGTKALYQAYRDNPTETEDTLRRIDKECEDSTITLKTVQSNFLVNKHTYVSEVINAFLLNDRNRWYKYQLLLSELGQEISYYAMYKYVKKLVKCKNDYLQNKDVDIYIVKQIDAPLICYAYVLFANTNNYKCLLAILCAIEHRSQESLSTFLKSD